MAASVADLRKLLIERGFSEPDADFIAELANDLRDGVTTQALERVEQRVGHFEALLKERLNGHEKSLEGHEKANEQEFGKVLSTIREVVANAQKENEKRFSEINTANEKRFSEVNTAIANAQTENGKRFSALAERLNGLEGQISELRGEVTGLKGQVDGLQGQINGLQGQIDGLRGEVNGLRSEIAGLKNSMDALRGELRGWVSQAILRGVVIQAGLIGLIFAILGALGVFS